MSLIMSAYSELLLDNLSQGGGRNQPGIRAGQPYGTTTLVGTSFANVSTSETAVNYNTV